MPSTLSWLDASAEDQRRMREIVAIFNQPDSRDELGIGQIRDVLSDALFPGTSVLIARARYLLFVPWCFQKAGESNRPGADARRDGYERDLIETLRRDGVTDGLPGARVGRALKTLPSTTYWNSIRRWDVLNDRGSTWQDALGEGARGRAREDDDLEPVASAWSSSMPKPPHGFPNQVPGGFDLTADEANWLAGRILTSCDGTLLAHLIEHRPNRESSSPWRDPAALEASDDIRATLELARTFSQLVQGAALLYNLLLAEAYAEAGFPRALKQTADDYANRLSAWEVERDRTAATSRTWSFDELHMFVRSRNPGVTSRTWTFLQSWSDIASPGNVDLVNSPAARRLIVDRERKHKGAHARLQNHTMLRSWSGEAGTGAIKFRWNAVGRILTDIHEGLERGSA